MCCPARQEGPPERSLACRPPAEVAALAPVVATAWGLQQPFAVVGLGSPEHIVALPGCTSRPALAPPGSSRRARLGQGAPGSCSLQIASMPAKKKHFPFVKVTVEFSVVPSRVSWFKQTGLGLGLCRHEISNSNELYLSKKSHDKTHFDYFVFGCRR